MSEATAQLSSFLRQRSNSMLEEGTSPQAVANDVARWAYARLLETADLNALASALASRGVTIPSKAHVRALDGTVISKTITANGTYSAADDDARGYDEVSVQVPHPSKTITANGTYLASDDGVAGWGEVVVETYAYTHGWASVAGSLVGTYATQATASMEEQA